jgi:hypothetical protein
MTPTITYTPIPFEDVFYVGKNAFNPAQGPVSIFIFDTQYPGPYSFKIYNSAGEFIKTLVPDQIANTIITYPDPGQTGWDGTDEAGNRCASGVYLFYLVEPNGRKLKKIILTH